MRKNKLYLIKKDNTKQTKRKIITNVILSLIVFISFTFSESTIYYMLNTYTNQTHYRRFFLGYNDGEKKVEEHLEEIKNIPHVIDVYEQWEERQIVSTISLGNTKLDGDVNLVGKPLEELLNISNNKYQDKYSIMCPELFINNVDIEVNYFTPRSSLIKMNKYVNEKMVVGVNNISDDAIKEIELNLVSTYKNEIGATDHAECYVSHDLIKELRDIYISDYDDESLNYKAYLLIIDDIKNEDIVRKILNNIGYEISQTSWLNYDFLNFLKALRYYLSYIVIIFAVVFIFKFTIGSIEDKSKEYSIYKSIGMKDKDYRSLIYRENLYCFIKSVIYTLLIVVIFSLIFNIVIYNYPFILMRIVIKPYFPSLFVYYLISYILMHLSSLYALQKIKKRSFDTNLSW